MLDFRHWSIGILYRIHYDESRRSGIAVDLCLLCAGCGVYAPDRISNDKGGISQRCVDLSVALEEEASSGLKPIVWPAFDDLGRHAGRGSAQVDHLALDDEPVSQPALLALKQISTSSKYVYKPSSRSPIS